MTDEDLFRIWAPDASAWAAWAKPVLFAHAAGKTIAAANAGAAEAGGEAATAGAGDDDLSPVDGRTAVVVDLPGPASVAVGLRLARLGYRPVPLFNAVPPPSPSSAAGPTGVVDVVPILSALVVAAGPLSALNLPPDAPPAFLLDHDRRTGTSGGPPEPGQFDNRSVSLPTDFPSGPLLRSKGVERVVVVQPTPGQPQADLRHTLVRWQREGLAIAVRPTDPPGPPQPITFSEPRGFGQVWQRALAVLGLARSPFGGFGGTLPEPGSGG